MKLFFSLLTVAFCTLPTLKDFAERVHSVEKFPIFLESFLDVYDKLCAVTPKDELCVKAKKELDEASIKKYGWSNHQMSLATQFAEKHKFSSLVPSKKVLAGLAFVAAVVVIAYVYSDALYNAGVAVTDFVRETFNKIYRFFFESGEAKALREAKQRKKKSSKLKLFSELLHLLQKLRTYTWKTCLPISQSKSS